MVSNHLGSLKFRSWRSNLSLQDAVALVCLVRIIEFHLYPHNTGCSNKSQFSLNFRQQTRVTRFDDLIVEKFQFRNSKLQYSKHVELVLNTLVFSSLNKPRSPFNALFDEAWRNSAKSWPCDRAFFKAINDSLAVAYSTASLGKNSMRYELFKYNNFHINHLSWNYRGCWHQTCPQIASQ